MKRQTAVEWLIEKLKSQGLLIGEFDNLIAVKQAKEMEKEKMIDFHVSVMKKGLIEEGDREWTDAYLPKIREVAEQCYKETYEQ
jgi:hypothetical protein